MSGSKRSVLRWMRQELIQDTEEYLDGRSLNSIHLAECAADQFGLWGEDLELVPAVIEWAEEAGEWFELYREQLVD